MMRACSILLMDATPIIFLAKIGRLDLLCEFNIPVFMPEEVRFEATRKQSYEESRDQNDEELLIDAFINKHIADGTLKVVTTLVCEAAALKRKKDPSYNSKGDGDVAANSLFLNRGRYGVTGPALLLYEDADLEVVFAREDVHFLTTYSMLVAMEKNGKINSADVEWGRLNQLYAKKNAAPLPRKEKDLSNRGDTEYVSRLRRRKV